MKQKGFTLIEMVVVLAVVAILAAILVPTIAKNIQDANISRAQNETQVIAASIASFYKDLGRWPTTDGTANLPDVHYLLYSQGNDTAVGNASQWNQAHADSSDAMEKHLVTNQPGVDGTPGANAYPTTGRWRWRGPYIAEIPADPFGIHYSCNVRYLYNTTTNAVYVLSAGPDKVWDTAFTQAMPGTIANDDIGTPVK
ncbi:MAG: type II secretion system protein [Candidatus Aminicenantia bacterium]